MAGRGRGRVPAAGGGLELGHPGWAPRLVVAGGAPPGTGHRRGHRAVDPLGPRLRRLQPDHRPVSVVAFVMPLALAASGWGMFIRARRQLLLSLRERALRAEADQELARGAGPGRRAHPHRPRDARRARPPDLADGAARRRTRGTSGPAAAQVQETAALLRATARQALEELRGVIGLLREDAGTRSGGCPQPTWATSSAWSRRRGGRYGHRLRDARGARGDVPARWGATPTASCRRPSPTRASMPMGPRPGCGYGAPGDGPARQRPQRQPVPATAPSACPGRARAARAAGAGRPGRGHPGGRPRRCPATSWWRRS